MASEATLFTKDGEWKVEVEAWRNYFFFYKSIGTQVDVYHRETTTNIWGSKVVDWVSKRAASITIVNKYSGSGPGVGTRNKVCTEASHCELKEWAVGITVTIPVDEVTDVGGGAILDIEKVEGSVTVRVGNETLSATVTASSPVSDNSIW